jgi:hypothetical protein
MAIVRSCKGSRFLPGWLHDSVAGVRKIVQARRSTEGLGEREQAHPGNVKSTTLSLASGCPGFLIGSHPPNLRSDSSGRPSAYVFKSSVRPVQLNILYRCELLRIRCGTTSSTCLIAVKCFFHPPHFFHPPRGLPSGRDFTLDPWRNPQHTTVASPSSGPYGQPGPTSTAVFIGLPCVVSCFFPGPCLRPAPVA